MHRLTLAALALVAIFAALSAVLLKGGGSFDLKAMWLAGEALRDGRPDLVYPKDAGVFTMTAPAEWYVRHPFEDDLYPYLYAPIWAALMGQVGTWVTMEAVFRLAGLVNALLLAGCLVLAWRIAGRTMSATAYIALGLVLLLGSNIGLVALYQNQPQILVAFLMLLAIERSESGAAAGAGIALACAAALKVYPVIFALVWVVTGNWRALVAFAATGAALAALSVAATGWPLHAEFLAVLRLASRTAMDTAMTYGVDAILSQTLLADGRVLIVSRAADPAIDPEAGWHVAAKPAWLAAVALFAQLSAIVLAGLALRRTHGPEARAAIWAAALTAVAFLGPFAWAYYYMAPAAFLPALVARFGWRGGALVAAIVIPVSVPFTMLDVGATGTEAHAERWGAASAVMMAAAFVWFWRRARAAGR